MKNLTGTQECDIDIALELQGAGITFERVETPAHKEVPYHLIGKLIDWTFERAWTYWVVTIPEGKGIPENNAYEFNIEWSTEVRLNGLSGGTKTEVITNWLSTEGTIDNYHINTQEGLNAFADLVRKLSKLPV